MRRSLAVVGFVFIAAACSPQAPGPVVLPAQGASARTPSAASGFRIVYSFKGGRDGAQPYSAPVELGGLLYGTTAEGGTGCSGLGCGTVFAIDATGSERVVYRFTSPRHGSGPLTRLLALRGALYGTTHGADRNIVFGVTPAGDLRTLYTLPPATYSDVSLTAGGGELYGTVSSGGTFYGEIYAVNPSTGQSRIVRSFTKSSDLRDPSSNLLPWNGSFYGVARTLEASGGTIYRLSPDGAMRKRFVFPLGTAKTDAPYGAFPSGLVELNGRFYGATVRTSGDPSQLARRSIVFEYDPVKNSVRVVHRFSKDETGVVQANLTALNGKLYGTMIFNGSALRGALFEVDPVSGAGRVLHRFTGRNDGGKPIAGVSAADGVLYGTAFGGGSYGYGVVFSYRP
jgi:uncharacterized repeat protein (TIGR03803 family)